MNIVSIDNPLKHERWGNHCDAWRLVDEPSLSVKLEHMPPGTSEVLHYHREAKQFFFILQGRAAFEIEGVLVMLNEQQGIQVAPGEQHRIINGSDKALQFLVCSQPSTQNDRYNIA